MTGRAGTDGGAPLLRLTDVHVRLSGSHILQGVDLTVRRGGVTALLGRNGAGKTTTVKAILGLVPSTGAVELTDTDGTRTTGVPSYSPQPSPGATTSASCPARRRWSRTRTTDPVTPLTVGWNDSVTTTRSRAGSATSPTGAVTQSTNGAGPVASGPGSVALSG